MDQTAPRPRHFWPVAAASLLWNLFGAYDWLMTNSRNAAYLAPFPPEYMQYVDAMPYWALGSWALGVWAAVAGSILLLRRSRFAVQAFAASLLGLAASTAYQAGIGRLDPTPPGAPLGMTLMIWIVAIALLWYAAAMRRSGILT